MDTRIFSWAPTTNPSPSPLVQYKVVCGIVLLLLVWEAAMPGPLVRPCYENGKVAWWWYLSSAHYTFLWILALRGTVLIIKINLIQKKN